MTLHFGNVPASTTLYIPFASYDSNGASITLTGLAVTDIEIYKDGSVTQRSSDAGYTLLDTDGIDFDGLTGIHGFSIDLSDNTDAGFYAVGSQYWVVVSAVTIDTQTVNFIAATFRIVPAEGSAGVPKVDVSHFGGSAGTFASGVPAVNATQVSGDSTAANTLELFAEALDQTTGQIDSGSFAAGAINAAALATDAASEIATATSTAMVTDNTGLGTGDLVAGAPITILVDAVLGELLSGHTTAGTLGKAISDILGDTGELQGDWVNGGRLDLLIDGIKAKTDDLTFTVANSLDANIQHVNDTVVTGAGSTADPWGP